MAESPESTESLVKREDEPRRDPIVGRSTSAIILISTLLLVFSAVWALYDEAYGQRPWRGIQRQFVQRYTAYLRSIRGNAGKTEAEIKETAEYQQLDAAAKAAEEPTTVRRKEIDTEVRKVQKKLDAVTDPYQNQRGRTVVITFNLEAAKSARARNNLTAPLNHKKQERVAVDLPDDAGKEVRQQMDYAQLETMFN